MSNLINVQVPKTVIGMGGVHNIKSLVKEFKPSKILIITMEDILKAGLINGIKSSLEEAGYKVDVFDGCKPNALSSSVEKCSQLIMKNNYSLLIGVGGGSVMDTTKVASVMAPNDISLQDIVSGKVTDKVLPKILVPTTAGTGSEWDEGAVVLDESEKLSRWIVRDEFLANAVVIDGELTLGLPKKVTAETGMDALSHAIEAYISPGANIISDMFAETAIKLISENLRVAYTGGKKATEARYKMSIAAAVGMKAQMIGGGSLAHAMNAQVVIKSNCSHGIACSILLPHNMQFELSAIPERLTKIAELMGERVERFSTLEAAHKAVKAVKQLSEDVEMPQTLSQVGITEADINKFVDYLVKFRMERIRTISYREVDKDDLIQIYKAAL